VLAIEAAASRKSYQYSCLLGDALMVDNGIAIASSKSNYGIRQLLVAVICETICGGKYTFSGIAKR